MCLLKNKLRTYLQIRATKAERFAVEAHHFKIQHAEIIGRGERVWLPANRRANPTLTLSLTLIQTPLPQLTASSPFMAGLVSCVWCTRAAASMANANQDPTNPADQFMTGAW